MLHVYILSSYTTEMAVLVECFQMLLDYVTKSKKKSLK